ncbi:MAG: hypothetical protein ACRDHO_12910 [Actinomycetota bacterium]
MARILLALFVLIFASPAWAHQDRGIHGRVRDQVESQSPRVGELKVTPLLINRRSESVRFFCIVQILDKWRFHGDPALGQSNHDRTFADRFTIGARILVPPHTTAIAKNRLRFRVRHPDFATTYNATPLQWTPIGMELTFQHCHDQRA